MLKLYSEGSEGKYDIRSEGHEGECTFLVLEQIDKVAHGTQSKMNTNDTTTMQKYLDQQKGGWQRGREKGGRGGEGGNMKKGAKEPRLITKEQIDKTSPTSG